MQICHRGPRRLDRLNEGGRWPVTQGYRMRHLLGRAAVVACTLALYVQPASAHSVPKHHAAAPAKCHSAKAHEAKAHIAKTHGAKTHLAKAAKAPKLRP